jgi:hypothetical protein
VRQEKSGRVFRTALSVRNGEAINLQRAIKGGVLHEMIPFLGIGQQSKGCEQHRNRIQHLSGSRLPFEIVKHTQQRAYFPLLAARLRPETASGLGLSILRCSLFSHRQNDAELCFAAPHARVGFGRFVERIGFDHGMHAG